MKTLVVEDSDRTRAELLSMLHAIPGVTVVGEAVDSDEAVAAILRLCPDVVTLDLTLRTGSGLTVLQTIKQVRPETTILIVTNHTTPPYVDRCAALGADGFFDKSAEWDKLRAACVRLAHTLSHDGGATS